MGKSRHQFDRDIAITTKEASVYHTCISDSWSINGVPDGGYLMAILAEAMGRNSDRRSTPIITANYLARCISGEAVVRVAKIGQSKQFERFQASLDQDGTEKIRAIGTFASPSLQCAVERYESNPPDLPPPDDCLKLPPLPNYTLFEQMDIRLDPACTGWMTTGLLSEKSQINGWIQFSDRRPFDMAAILLAADSFPPAVMASQGMVAWVPTIELSVNIRNRPQGHWLKGIFNTHFITCGLLAEDGELWDAENRLVAISRQTAQYRTAGPG